MRRRYLFAMIAAGAAAWLAAQVAGTGPVSPLTYFPAGAMLTLEARDFGALLREWNGSQAKTAWLASDAYRQFVVSRLAQRMQEAQQEFSDTAKAGIDMDLVAQLAGDRTAFALYDAGELEFLLMTRMPEARFATSLLGTQRRNLSPRQAGGTPYFVMRNPGSAKTVAFGTRNEWLIVATSENLVAQALQRMASTGAANGLTTEDWYLRGARAAGSAGELRMATNVDALYKSPHFRSYWIHRNREELAPFAATFSDLDRQPASWTERRVLVRKQAQAAATSNLAQVLRSVPQGAGLYQAWAQPSPEAAASLLVRKFFDPAGTRASSGPQFAPSIGDIDESGEENDWENRIDAAPFVAGDPGPDYDRVTRWLASVPLTGMLVVQSTKDAQGGVWIEQDTGMVLTRGSNWNANEVQSELAVLGVGRVESAVDGDRLYIASNSALLAAMRTGGGAVIPPGAANTFAAGFRHGAERDRYVRWMQRIDQPTNRPLAQGEQPVPQFMTDIVPSLSRILARLDEHMVVTADDGDRLTETIVYRWRQ